MVTYDARPSAFTQLTTTTEWEAIHSAMGCRDGVDLSAGSAMTPSLDTGGRNAVIADGNVVIKGQLWRCDAAVNTAIPAASAQNRIDRLVLRLTRGASTAPTVVAPFVITGTPSGSPAIPALTRTPTGIWDLPISRWTATSAGGLTGLVDERQYSLDCWHDMRPLTNNFVGTNTGEYPPQYRLNTFSGLVEIVGAIQTPPSGAYNGIIFFTFPANSIYIPAQGTSWAVVHLAGTPNGDTNGWPRCFVDTTGTIQINGFQSSQNATVARINGFYPVAGFNGLITS